MKLNFKDSASKKNAINVLSKDYVCKEKILEKEDAFLILIHGETEDNLSNLCTLLSEKLHITHTQAYIITQNPTDKKQLVLTSAYELLSEGKYLGNNMNYDGSINSSSWISHSLYEAKLCAVFAQILNLDENFAFSYGLLHDYGRKFSHRFDHVVKGFERLFFLGFEDISKGCLTHSFIEGKRYGNNESISEGFNVDQLGNEVISNELKDDLFDVLTHSKYTIYDKILNVSDLMATDKGIVSPKDRLNDIAKRRENIDSSLNRQFFLVLFHNLLLEILQKMGLDMDIPYLDLNSENIKEKFDYISDIFFNEYNEKIENIGYKK